MNFFIYVYIFVDILGYPCITTNPYIPTGNGNEKESPPPQGSRTGTESEKAFLVLGLASAPAPALTHCAHP